MPYYERTGMISHRHPFYGVGYLAQDEEWTGDDEEMLDQIGPWAPGSGGRLPTGPLPAAPPSEVQNPLPAPPAPTVAGTRKWLLPVVVGGVMIAGFLFLQGGASKKRR